jgi:hypothetical protein
MRQFQTWADAFVGQNHRVGVLQALAIHPEHAEVIDALPDNLVEIGRAAAEASSVKVQRRLTPSGGSSYAR